MKDNKDVKESYNMLEEKNKTNLTNKIKSNTKNCIKESNNIYTIIFIYRDECSHCKNFMKDYGESKNKILENHYINYREVEAGDEYTINFLKKNIALSLIGVPNVIFVKNSDILDDLTILGNNIEKFKKSIKEFFSIIKSDKSAVKACSHELCGFKLN